MTVVSVSVLKAKLSEYIGRAKAGEEVLVTEHGKPVVTLNAIKSCDAAAGGERARMQRLAAQGLVKLGKGRISAEFFEREPVKLKHGSAAEAVLAEREEAPY
jgi:prevent-host-death family protein